MSLDSIECMQDIIKKLVCSFKLVPGDLILYFKDGLKRPMHFITIKLLAEMTTSEDFKITLGKLINVYKKFNNFLYYYYIDKFCVNVQNGCIGKALDVTLNQFEILELGITQLKNIPQLKVLNFTEIAQLSEMLKNNEDEFYTLLQNLFGYRSFDMNNFKKTNNFITDTVKICADVMKMQGPVKYDKGEKLYSLFLKTLEKSDLFIQTESHRTHWFMIDTLNHITEQKFPLTQIIECTKYINFEQEFLNIKNSTPEFSLKLIAIANPEFLSEKDLSFFTSQVISKNKSYKMIVFTSVSFDYLDIPLDAIIKITDSEIRKYKKELPNVNILIPKKAGDEYGTMLCCDQIFNISRGNPSIPFFDFTKDVTFFIAPEIFKEPNPFWGELESLVIQGATRRHNQSALVSNKQSAITLVSLLSEEEFLKFGIAEDQISERIPICAHEVTIIAPEFGSDFNKEMIELYKETFNSEPSFTLRKLKDMESIIKKWLEWDRSNEKLIKISSFFHVQCIPKEFDGFLYPIFENIYKAKTSDKKPKLLYFISHKMIKNIEDDPMVKIVSIDISNEDPKILSLGDIPEALGRSIYNDDEFIRNISKISHYLDYADKSKTIKNINFWEESTSDKYIPKEMRSIVINPTLLFHIEITLNNIFLDRPMVFIGETGSGKTIIMMTLKKLFQRLQVFNNLFPTISCYTCDSGITLEEYRSFFDNSSQSPMVLFLDEFNTLSFNTMAELEVLENKYENITLVCAINPISESSEETRLLMHGGLKVTKLSDEIKHPIIKELRTESKDIVAMKYSVNPSLPSLLDIAISRDYRDPEEERVTIELCILNCLYRARFNNYISADEFDQLRDYLPGLVAECIRWNREKMRDHSSCSMRNPVSFMQIFCMLKKWRVPNTEALIVSVMMTFALKLQENVYTDNGRIELRSEFIKFVISKLQTELNEEKWKDIFERFCYKIIFSRSLKERDLKINDFRFDVLKIYTMSSIMTNIVAIYINLSAHKNVMLCGMPANGKSLSVKLFEKLFDYCIEAYFCSDGASAESMRASFDIAGYMHMNNDNKNVALLIEEIQNSLSNELAPQKALHKMCDSPYVFQGESYQVPIIMTSNFDVDYAIMNRFEMIFTESPTRAEIEASLRLYFYFEENADKVYRDLDEFIDVCLNVRRNKIDLMEINSKIKTFLDSILGEGDGIILKSMRSIYTTIDIFKAFLNTSDPEEIMGLSYQLATELINAKRLLYKKPFSEITDNYDNLKHLHRDSKAILQEWSLLHKSKGIVSLVVYNIREVDNLVLHLYRMSLSKIGTKSLLIVTKNMEYNNYISSMTNIISLFRRTALRESKANKYTFNESLTADLNRAEFESLDQKFHKFTMTQNEFMIFHADDFKNDPITITSRLIEKLKKDSNAEGFFQNDFIIGSIICFGSILDLIDGAGNLVSDNKVRKALLFRDSFTVTVDVKNRTLSVLVANIDDLSDNVQGKRAFMQQIIDRYEVIYLDNDDVAPIAYWFHAKPEDFVGDERFKCLSQRKIKELKIRTLDSLEELLIESENEEELYNEANGLSKYRRNKPGSVVITRHDFISSAFDNLIVVEESEIVSADQLAQIAYDSGQNYDEKKIFMVVCNSFDLDRDAAIKNVMNFARNIFNFRNCIILYRNLPKEQMEKIQTSFEWPVYFIESLAGDEKAAAMSKLAVFKPDEIGREILEFVLVEAAEAAFERCYKLCPLLLRGEIQNAAKLFQSQLTYLLQNDELKKKLEFEIDRDSKESALNYVIGEVTNRLAMMNIHFSFIVLGMREQLALLNYDIFGINRLIKVPESYEEFNVLFEGLFGNKEFEFEGFKFVSDIDRNIQMIFWHEVEVEDEKENDAEEDVETSSDDDYN